MFASVRSYQLDQGSIEDLMHRVDEQFVPTLSRQPGFVAYQAVDTRDGTLMTITVFHDSEQAVRSNHLAAEFVAERLWDMKLRRTSVKGGEVMVSRAAREVLEPAHT
jgi:hypothetical protein